VPAIVQDAATAQVLMLGYMDAAALKKTLRTKKVTFFSRTKNRLWTKGESSGNFLRLVSIEADCDHDTLLVGANPAGPTCHRGTVSCFGAGSPAGGIGFFAHLDQIVAARIKEGDPKSYTARLVRQGVARVAQKVGEEGVETALAALGKSNQALVGEAADLLYHLIVLLRARKLPLADCLAVLERRHAPRKG
jgi:phosphoribosyl-ATP pyrophosphohydrolase/phosphoribosyl-AMP cyclohydrolase